MLKNLTVFSGKLNTHVLWCLASLLTLVMTAILRRLEQLGTPVVYGCARVHACMITFM